VAVVALVAAFCLSLPFVFVLVRRPVLRRLAVRNARRRPREAMLVVVGSMLGAAIITGSFVVGDTLAASTRQLAHSHLGPIDEVVQTSSRSSWEAIAARLRRLPAGDVDGVLPFRSIDAAVTAGRPGSRRSAPHSQVVAVDFAAARSFGNEPSATGFSGENPVLFRAAVTTDLARSLDVRPGDQIQIWAYGLESTLKVDRILPRRGVAGFSLDQTRAEANNVFVGSDTFSFLSSPVSHPEYFAPTSYSVAVSNRGGVENGVGRTDRVAAEIRRLAGRVDVVKIKQVVLDEAKANGDAFTQLFTGMGSFGVLAGVLLLVNLFVMLAAERKPELGMARAVGMRRSWLVAGFATEGWLYALLASLVGTLVGIGLGRLIIAASARMFSTEHNRFELLFTVRGPSIAEGFAIGFLIALVTVVATSVRISRLNIIAAIRDLPDLRAGRRRNRWLALGAVAVAAGAVWTVSAIPDEEPFGLLLGPTLVLVGLGPILTRLWPARAVATWLAALVGAWGVLVFALSGEAGKNASMMVWVAQGVVLTGAAVILITLQQERLAKAIRRLVPGQALALRLGLAYPLARRSRTGLTVAMYALVVFILTFITTLSAMIGDRVDSATRKVAGGYSVVVSSSTANPIPLAAVGRRPGVVAVAPLSTVTASFTRQGDTTATPWPLSAFDRRFFRFGRSLASRGSYPTDRAAWEAVLHDPSLVIVDENFLVHGGGPGTRTPAAGDRLTVTDEFTGATRHLTVAAIAQGDVLIGNGALYGLAGARTLFGDRLVPSRAFVALGPGVDSERFAASLQGAYLSNGAEASSIRALMEEAFSIWDAMFQLFQGYLGLGLIVGIAGLAVVMVRAVRERRRQIGMLRALGFGWETIGRSFAIESGYIAVEGTLIGAGLALLTITNIVANTDVFGDMRVTVPWISLAVMLVGTVAASLLATMGPAIAATRIKPAVALRTTD
jgi:putative ABC transport system permease protein